MKSGAEIFSNTFNLPSRILLPIIVVLMSLLSACSLLRMFTHTTPLKAIQVIAEINANQNSATAIDVVFVYEKDAIGLLPKTAPDWFAKKTALMLSMATNIDVVSLQVPPATIASVDLPSKHSKAIGVYSFINTLDASGQAVGNLTPYKTMAIWLTPSSVVYQGQ